MNSAEELELVISQIVEKTELTREEVLQKATGLENEYIDSTGALYLLAHNLGVLVVLDVLVSRADWESHNPDWSQVAEMEFLTLYFDGLDNFLLLNPFNGHTLEVTRSQAEEFRERASDDLEFKSSELPKAVQIICDEDNCEEQAVAAATTSQTNDIWYCCEAHCEAMRLGEVWW